MLNAIGTTALALACITTLSLTTGCVCTGSCRPAGPTQETTSMISRDDIETLVVSIEMGVGEVYVDGGAPDTEVLDATFTFNIKEWEPTVEYEVRGDTGYLTISQPDADCHSCLSDVENEWHISLNRNVPTSIEVDTGVAATELNLSGMRVTRLNADHGVGNMLVNATGQRIDDLHILVDGGVGKTKILLPHSVGVRVDCETGIGSVAADNELHEEHGIYVNDAYGETEATIDVTIETGIGSIELDLSS